MTATSVADTSEKPAGAAASPLAEAFRKGMASPVPTNPAMLEFPADKWGFTSEFRKAALKMAGGIRGNKEKHDLVMLTMGILAKHILARYLADKDYNNKLLDEIERLADARPTR